MDRRIKSTVINSLAAYLCVAFGACAAPFHIAEAPPIVALRTGDSPLCWPAAHQGCSSELPGNSLVALRCAAAHLIPLIETDIRRGADGTLFLFHNRRLHSGSFIGPAALTDRAVETLNAAEMSEVCYPPKGSECATTFREALRDVQGTDSVLQLDLKGESRDLVDAVIAEARASGQSGQILIQCQQYETALYLREEYPEIPLLARLHDVEHIDLAIPLRPEIIQLEPEWLVPANLEKIRRSGSRILVKALGDHDTPAQWRALHRLGSDIILTDHAVRFLEQQAAICR